MEPDLTKARLFVVLLFLVFFLTIMIYNIWAWMTYGREATVSNFIWDWSKKWPLLPYLAGFLTSHLFW